MEVNSDNPSVPDVQDVRESTPESQSTMSKETQIFRWDAIPEPPAQEYPLQDMINNQIAVQRFLHDHLHMKPYTDNAAGNEFWCFLYAVQLAFARKFSIIPALPWMFKLIRCHSLDEPGFDMDNNADCWINQGAMIVHTMGRALGKNNVELGIWKPNAPGKNRPEDPHVTLFGLPGTDNAVADYTIWLKHTEGPDRSHFDALVAVHSNLSLESDVLPYMDREQGHTVARRILAIDKAMVTHHLSIVDLADDVILKLVYRNTRSKIRELLKNASFDQLPLLVVPNPPVPLGPNDDEPRHRYRLPACYRWPGTLGIDFSNPQWFNQIASE